MDLIPDHPVELFKPADHILLGEPGGTWPLIVIKPPPTAPSCYYALSAVPMGASVVQGTLLLGWESLWPMNSLSHLSNVKCHVFGHCQNPRSGITHSLSNGISRRWSKQHVNIIYQIIFFDLVHFLNSDFKKYKTFSCTLKSLVGLLCI